MALILRVWNVGAVFESSDQAAMTHMVRYNWGIKWIFAHDYGPVLPLIHRVFAEVLSLLHWPISEAAARFPVMLNNLGLVVMTYPLLRRLGRPRGEALLGAACCTVLPTLVSDSHYAWGVHTTWLFMGVTALWATLAYIDERRGWQLGVAAAALAAHCLSGLYAFALPLTLMGAWGLAWAAQHVGSPTPLPLPASPTHYTSRQRLVWPAITGFVAPCLAALAVILFAWRWTGKGQIGRLLGKQATGTFGLHTEQILRLPWLWFGQLGFVFGVISAVGLIAGVVYLARRDRRGLLAIWAINGLWPTLLIVDWHGIGVPQGYLFEVLYTAGLLGTLLLGSTYRAWPRWRPALVVVSAAVAIQLAAGSLSVCVADTGLRRLAGTTGGWGDVRPDTGIKAAGWYVRECVPAQAIVLSLHTNVGMELPVAELYLGRHVLAGYDHLPPMLPAIVQAMRDKVDVLILEAQHRGMVEDLTDFERVCTIRNHGQPVRYVYARRSPALPRVVQDVSVLNARYDDRYQPCHVPVPLPSAPGFDQLLEEYQRTVKELKKQW